jgi:hypothetical protein
MSSLFNWINVNHAADVAQLVGIPLAAIALWIAAIQLKAAAKTANDAEAVAEAQTVLLLDLVLAQQTFMEIRGRLADGKIDNPDDNTKVDLRRYVAALERLGVLVGKDVVSPELANAFYGSRLQKLINNAPYAVNMVNNRQAAWNDFIILWRTLEKYWEKDSKRPSAP